MADSLRTDSSRVADAASDADRDAKIEELLLVGLDHYFAAQYDQAINVWTRALFLDRNHPRARAYIERARSALAERQRASEELLQSGVAAFDRGDADEARRLLQAAIDGGAPSEEALPVLDRLNRLETAIAATPAPAARTRRPGAAPGDEHERPFGSAAAAAIGAALIVLAVGAYAAVDGVGLPWRSWMPLPAVRTQAAPSPIVRDAVLSIPRRGEMALARARALAATGHLHDALAALDAVKPSDPQKPEADRLRADIQRQLLGLTTSAAPR